MGPISGFRWPKKDPKSYAKQELDLRAQAPQCFHVHAFATSSAEVERSLGKECPTDALMLQLLGESSSCRAVGLNRILVG